MDLFSSVAYDKLVELFKFRFYKQIKDTGIVFKELLEAKNLETNKRFYILICDDQEKIHSIRFKNLKVLIIVLTEMAKNRLQRLEVLEKELLQVNDTETYGESRYFNDTEMTATGISSIKELLKHFEKNKTKWNK